MDKLQIHLGDNGFSVCHTDHPVIGECLIDGIQHFGVALEVHEMAVGEMEEEEPCQAASAF